MSRISKSSFIFAFILPSIFYAIPNPEPLSVAAEYYFARHDFRQALQLWNEVYRRTPENTSAMLRVAELQLLYEGRSISKDTILKFLEKSGGGLTMEGRQAIRLRLGEMQATFLSDETQSLFLRASTKIRYSDWNGALALLNQGLNLEKGNFALLKAKAVCEKALASYDKYYGTLKSALEVNPFDPQVIESLVEAQYFFKDYKDAVALFQKEPELLLSFRQRIAYGLSLFEAGLESEALSILNGVAEQTKQTGAHPAIWYGIGRILSKQSPSSGEGYQYLDRFVTATSRPESSLIDGWDPYRTPEKAEEAKRIISAFKEAGSIHK